MSYWKRFSGKTYQSLDNYSNVGGSTSQVDEFYEFEPAIVLDVILDDTHEYFKNNDITKLEYDRWPKDVDGKKPLKDDVDYTWIGRALVRMVESQQKVEKPKLIWAKPLESNISEYPLINEVVFVVKCLDGGLYYTKKVNSKNFINQNADFGMELLYGGFENGVQKGNSELSDSKKEFKGPICKTRANGGYGFEGVVGRYFWINDNIRSIRRYEGDLVIESRFGQSIRFSAYDKDRKNDESSDSLDDYKTDGTPNPISNVKAGGGNPMIIIRNRQRPIKKEGESYQLHEKLPAVIGTKAEKNVGGYIEEDINNDGSTIAITSGKTESKWKTTCYKKMWEEGMEEQEAFSPVGCSNFKYPTLNGEQIVINTDRLILSSRMGETFHYSKKRYGIVTDSEYTVDAHDQIVFNTNVKTVFNSPAIYLGEYDMTNEPVLLGQTTCNWLWELCMWLLKHTHWYVHSHVDAGDESPSNTQIPKEQQELIALRDALHALLSRRVFVTGGGFAPGQDGMEI